MRFPKLSFVPLAVACLTFAVAGIAQVAQAARAATTQAPSVEDATLEADYLALIDRADACVHGTCADAAAIRSDFTALELRRAALTTKSAAIDLLAGTLQTTFGGWEEQS